ncbi:MAG: DUF4423 domain-containing protein [Bdellovibrionaceae bacterium]|nr:DUF4423 domain-containing protein [Pseudobdellovibrionaceae bacterium]
MRIFEAKTFGDFLKKYLKTLPNRGRGALRGISVATGIHSTTLSQAVKGARHFSLEQVADICRYLGLSELETKYALLLSQAERAGTDILREFFFKELKLLRQQSLELVHVVKQDKILTDNEKAIFYSNWYYGALAVLSSIPGLNNPISLSSRTGLSRQRANHAIEFLVRTGICVDKNGKIEPGTNSTHLEAGSPLVSRHHGNWRIKAMEKHPNLDLETEMAYSSPMSLAKQDANRIRALIVDLVKKVSEIRTPSPCEEAYFLNIDWIKM